MTASHSSAVPSFSVLLDALQIVLLGGDRSRVRFNAQI